MTDTSSIRREMAETRAEMAQTVEELQDRAAEKVASVKRRLDVGRAIREHPWPALGAAVAVGAIIGAGGVDETVASASIRGAKQAGRVTADAAKGRIQKLRSRHDASAETRSAASHHEPEKPGPVDRLFEGIASSMASIFDRVLDEVRVASRDWGARVAGSNRAHPVVPRPPRPVAPATRAVATRAIAVTQDAAGPPSAADGVPLPNEMAPAELGLRADAVEAMGGGTHEPPLEPGAGELGARWS